MLRLALRGQQRDRALVEHRSEQWRVAREEFDRAIGERDAARAATPAWPPVVPAGGIRAQHLAFAHRHVALLERRVSEATSVLRVASERSDEAQRALRASSRRVAALELLRSRSRRRAIRGAHARSEREREREERLHIVTPLSRSRVL